MVQLIVHILKFLAKAYGMAAEKGIEHQHAKGLEAKVKILEAEVAREEKTEAILHDTMRKDENDLPYFDYSNVR